MGPVTHTGEGVCRPPEGRFSLRQGCESGEIGTLSSRVGVSSLRFRLGRGRAGRLWWVRGLRRPSHFPPGHLHAKPNQHAADEPAYLGRDCGLLHIRRQVDVELGGFIECVADG
jgi:hypothetical protein